MLRCLVPYADLDEAEQVAALRPAAVRAAARFGLDVQRVEVVAHVFNTTFRVDTRDGERVALRVHTNSVSTEENVRAQLAWQRAIADETDVWVPRPLTADDGDWFVRVECEGYGRPVIATAATWLDGDEVEDLDEEIAHAMGRALARLHDHAAAWQPPTGSRLERFDDPLFRDPDLLSGARGLDEEGRDVIRRALDRCDAAFARALREGQELRALHADLHGGNLMWAKGRLGVFDFDDSGLGTPALDLAIAAYYLRSDGEGREQAMRAAYGELAPLPEIDPADFEALVAARQLLLANSLLASNTRELSAMAEEYLGTTVTRLGDWLETGRFTKTRPRGRI
jgi:Ser/Thr protein kinase RdoA (MazF antagonist)